MGGRDAEGRPSRHCLGGKVAAALWGVMDARGATRAPVLSEAGSVASECLRSACAHIPTYEGVAHMQCQAAARVSPLRHPPLPLPCEGVRGRRWLSE